ncbi:GmrSD restriction endonuclease domain-containing protein [Streptosporangium sp. CA-115845]|uniref:GmrSD restriction endonuclease domain-containing protein n=1 Tax=Streptosporangium sp. CA-115845 TaxID=3240071 RepID=UPI003D8BA52D
MSPIPHERAHRPQLEKITELASRVRAGEIRLPKFQRQFVWKGLQVLDLLDSISRNYPIGSLLLWDSELRLASDHDIAGIEIDQAPNRERTAYLLDGCQRLSTICGALYWEPKGDPKSLWNLVYDFEEERFAHRKDFDEPPAHQIPLRLLAQPYQYAKWASKRLPEEFEEAAGQLFDNFANYETSVVTLKTASITEVGRIFERVNTRGTPLTAVQVIRAVTWRSDFDLLDAIDGVRDVLAAKNYGLIDQMLLLRAISAAAGLGFAKSDMEQLPSVGHERLLAAIEETEEAAKKAVDFLTTEIGTPTAAALPHANQLAVVIEIFRQIPRPNGKQFAQLRSWFWRTILGGYYDGWNPRKMAADLAAVTAFAKGETKGIEVDVPPPSTRLWAGKYDRGTAPQKTFALMLAARGPVDLITGAAIDVGKTLAGDNYLQFHHFFPKAALLRSALSFEQANVLANIVMLTAISNQKFSDLPPSAYLKAEIDFSDERTIRERLDTCLVSAPAFDAAMRGDYKAFIAARSETLLEWARDLIQRGLATEAAPAELDEESLRLANEVEVVDEDTDD